VAQEGIAERGGIQPTWFEHTEFNSIVRHKKDPAKLYLQIMNPNNIRSKYAFADGTPTTKAELVAMGAIKDEPGAKPITLVYALDSILSVRYKETKNQNNQKEVAA